jgi:hypothetical protein
LSTSQIQQPLVTSHDVEHPHAVGRRVKSGLTLFGVAAAGVLALIVTSPAALADTVELPDFPIATGDESDFVSTGLPPFYLESSFDQPGTYTDLLGVQVFSKEPLEYSQWQFPGDFNAIFDGRGITDDVNGLLAPFNGGFVGGDTFGDSGISPGLYNIYEVTPFHAADGDLGLNYNDILAFDPTGNPGDTGLSGIEFGIQYLDLPSALTPVDEINFLGSGGEILFSIPVTGDLLSLF